MKNYRALILSLFVVMILFSCQKEEKKNIVQDTVLETKAHKSVHFKALEKYYYSNQPDTTSTDYEVWIERDKSDSLRNGYIRVDNHYRPYNMFYDQGTFYLAIPPKRTTVPYTRFTEDLISPIDWIDIFLKPEKFRELTGNGDTSISNIEYKGKPCAKIEIRFPKDQNGKENTQTYIISKKNLFPLYSKLVTKDKKTTYTNELFFHDIIFDHVNTKELRKVQKEIIAANPLEPEGAGSEVAITERMLRMGVKAPLFEGKYYGTDKLFKLEDHIGKKVILVDFWYTHCPPCVRAMPALSELHTKYKDKGLVVFGLNSVDNQPRSMDNLNKFLKKRKLSYEVILTKPEVDQAYKIKAYPSMYVIDKKGKISFIEVGFDEEKFEKVIEHIEKLINQQ